MQCTLKPTRKTYITLKPKKVTDIRSVWTNRFRRKRLTPVVDHLIAGHDVGFGHAGRTVRRTVQVRGQGLADVGLFVHAAPVSRGTSTEQPANKHQRRRKGVETASENNDKIPNKTNWWLDKPRIVWRPLLLSSTPDGGRCHPKRTTGFDSLRSWLLLLLLLSFNSALRPSSLRVVPSAVRASATIGSMRSTSHLMTTSDILAFVICVLPTETIRPGNQLRRFYYHERRPAAR